MSSYHVDSAPAPTTSRLYLSVAAVLATAAMAAGMPFFGQLSVVVDGREINARIGARIDDISEEVHASDGDLLDVEGDLLVAGGGEQLQLLREGIQLTGEERLREGDVIESFDGEDVVESVVTTTSVIPIPLEWAGEGPFEDLTSPGSPGVESCTFGAVSGIVVTETVLVSPEPMVITRRGPKPGEKAVALTFDDGPWPGQTDRILDILAAEDAKATFFMVGFQVRKHRGLSSRVVREGHQAANHGLSHTSLHRADEALALSEIENCQDEIERATGVRPGWFRPAGGAMAPAVWHQTRVSKVRMMNWTIDPQDWRRPAADRLAYEVIESVRPGSVVLLHDGGGDRSATIEALPEILRELKARGYTFVTLDEMWASR